MTEAPQDPGRLNELILKRQKQEQMRKDRVLKNPMTVTAPQQIDEPESKPARARSPEDT